MNDAEDNENRRIKRRRLPNLDRQHIKRQYFDVSNPTYTDEQFRCRYRITYRLFQRIQNNVCTAIHIFKT